MTNPTDAQIWDLIPDEWTMLVPNGPGAKALVLTNVEDFARAILETFGAPQWQPIETAPQWQPIETAPKDEQIMLAIEFDGPNDWRIKTGYYFSEEQCWKVWGGSWQPTHWMPLPEAPQ